MPVKINPLKILNDLGYEMVDIESDEDYLSALMEAIVSLQGDGDSGRARADILQEELIRVRKERKAAAPSAGMKVTQKKISTSKFFGKEEKQTAANTTGTSDLAVRSKSGKIDTKKLIPEPTQEKGGVLAEILTGVNSIVDTLKAEKKQDKKHFSFLRKVMETFKRRKKENKLEFKVFEGLKNTVTKVLEPMKSAWSKFIEFVGNILLGNVLFKILNWMGNPENQGKLNSIIKFFEDWWPVLLGGYLIFGNALTGFAMGLLKNVVVWGAKLVATVIPALLKAAVAMGPWGIAAAAVLVGGAVVANQQIKKNRQAFDEQDDDSTLTVEEFQEDNQGITNPNEKTADIQPSQGYVETGSYPGMMNFNKGGTVPGSGNTDTVPAMLTPGEFVMSKGAVQKYGANTLEGLNAAAGGTNKPTLMGGYKERGFANITNTETTSGSNPFSFGVNYVSPEEAKERLAARGMPSMELSDGSVVPNFGKMGADSFMSGIQMVREGMANNPEKIQELDNFLETNPYAQPDELQRVINVVVPGSQAQVMSNLVDSITASARMNGGGLVQAFQGGGQVRRVQMGRGAAKRRMEASKITPIKKKKVTVAYAEEKQNMADKPNTGKSGQEIPSFNVTAMRSPEKIKLLGISV